MIYIDESQLEHKTMPECVCIYKFGNRFMLAEINTGRYKGCISKIISQPMNTIDEILKYQNISPYRFLPNYVIDGNN